MDIEAEKLELIKWLISLEDQAAIEKLRLLKETLSAPDWWDSLTEEQKQALDRGLDDIQHGRTTPHLEVIKRYAKY